MPCLKKDNNAGSIEWDGNDPSILILRNVSKSAKVVKGDTVVTSTYSANFPSNLMVGTISSIVEDPSSNFYTLKIKTATNFFTVQYVYLVENTRYAEQVQLENTPIKSDLTVRVGDRGKFKATPGRVGNRLAIQIGDNIEDIPDELLGSTRSEQEY